MTKKFPTKKQLAILGITNSWNLAIFAPDKVFIGWSPQRTGRAYQSASYRVIHLEKKTDPNSHWSDYGNKTFNLHGGREDRELKAKEAIDWANENFGAKKWARDPYGSYQDSAILPVVWAALSGLKENKE